MAINNFKPFAVDTNANVMSQTDWEALPALLSGFMSGKASSAQINKAIRQSATIASLVGQFIANSGIDALDNGDITGLVTNFTNALTANLNLKSASHRDVGTNTNQIPDMSAWTSGGGSSTGWWRKLPNGDIEQFGLVNGMVSNAITVAYPIAFPNELRSLMFSTTGNASANNYTSITNALTPLAGTVRDHFTASGYNTNITSAGGQIIPANVIFYWYAIGR